jgi:hypothetical protein
VLLWVLAAKAKLFVLGRRSHAHHGTAFHLHRSARNRHAAEFLPSFMACRVEN